MASGKCDRSSTQTADPNGHCRRNVNEIAEHGPLNLPGEISSGFCLSAGLADGNVHNRSSGQLGGGYRLSGGVTEARDQLGGLSGELTKPHLSGKLALDANRGAY
jgi:hypothetical protein